MSQYKIEWVDLKSNRYTAAIAIARAKNEANVKWMSCNKSLSCEKEEKMKERPMYLHGVARFLDIICYFGKL